MEKAVHIITRLDFGGAQGNTLYTAAHLDRARFEPLIITGRGGILDGEAPPGLLLESRYLARSINPWKDAAAFFELRSMLKELRPALVHTHSSKAGILGRLAAASAGVPVIIHTFHGFGFHPRQNFLVRSLYVALEKFCARFCDALVFVSRANMETARQAGIGRQAQYRLIRSGVKLSNYPATGRAARRAEFGFAADNVVVVSIGNAKPQKNPGAFLAAAARLAAAHPRARFLFVGGGESLDSLRAGARELGLEKTCIFTGWRKDTPELLAAGDIFALTSLWEGLPRSLVEAMRTGLPSVCYLTDGVADILQDGRNGFAVKQGDLDAFCAALSRLISDEDLRGRLAAGAAAADLAEFDIDFMVRSQEELYSELLRGKGANR
ncbi:MAG: glycosyltransferase family 4 protein [Elusimicrobia bacterium]|nr:glycosyltransferase family 4 protein [Elusimicrobiota bacterium]